MVAPAIIGAAIGAGASLLGGSKSNSENRDIARENAALQKEFAQHGVRWRVADAKAAGLHPLYALGAQVPSFTPSFQMDAMGPAISEAGQTIGRAVGSLATAQEKEAQALQLEQLRKNLEETDARIGMLNSEMFRNMQEAGPSFPSAGGGPNLVPEGQAPTVNRGMVSVVPSQVGTSSADDPSVGAGTNYTWRRYLVAPDFPVLLPGGPQGNIEEALESVTESIPAMVAVILENMARNPDFSESAVRHYLGDEAAALHRMIRKAGVFLTPGTVSDHIGGIREGFNRWTDRFRQLNK